MRQNLPQFVSAAWRKELPKPFPDRRNLSTALSVSDRQIADLLDARAAAPHSGRERIWSANHRHI